MNLIILKDFSGSAECNYVLYNCKDAFPQFSCKLKGGNLYAFISDFCYGSWGASEAIGGRAESYSGEIKYNGKVMSMDDLKVLSAFIAEDKFFPEIPIDREFMSCKTCLEYGIGLGNSRYSLEELKQIFELDNGRYSRPFKNNVSGDIWKFTIVINYVLGKELFCFPWMGEINKNRVEGVLKYISFLKSEGKIIIIPTSQERYIKKYCDYYLKFEKARIKYQKNNLNP